MNQLKGIHHVTAITSSAEKIYEFFTYTLGMRLVKKTVNQDDIQTYHLFFADDKGSAGTDMTFFDFPGISKSVHGTNEISKTSFRVPGDEALIYWEQRFDRLAIKHTGIKTQFGKKSLSFVLYHFAHCVLSPAIKKGQLAKVTERSSNNHNKIAKTGLKAHKKTQLCAGLFHFIFSFIQSTFPA